MKTRNLNSIQTAALSVQIDMRETFLPDFAVELKIEGLSGTRLPDKGRGMHHRPCLLSAKSIRQTVKIH